ncbi:uncharacterized protein LOC111610943 [Xiphophorus maculatus]|uniref:uncharacterized protein LOC111610943 n=1 Tax=Xiphophorus maculatus TaxID=8083 RepID=UPI000C6D00C5|nr:uncharacterized protein LOC111610943 [Xiphophorus maculatus]
MLMEEELLELKTLIAQLKADNEKLRAERSPSTSSSSAGPSSASALPTAQVTDRLVLVPRDRKCPMFRGRMGISVSEWVEEVQACIRARNLSAADQAFFLYDHLEGEARDEIKYRSSQERGDPAKIISILEELYGCNESHVALQEAFFSRKQLEGETLQEFSLALMSLMEKVKAQAPRDMPNTEVLLRDQFIEYVLDGALSRALKQYVRLKPAATLLDVRGEAMRWELEGLPASMRGRSNSLPLASSFQFAVRGGAPSIVGPTQREVNELKELLKQQQEQLNQLTQSISLLQTAQGRSRSPRRGPIICRRCQQPGHIARECGGPRVAFRQQSLSGSRQGSQLPEN